MKFNLHKPLICLGVFPIEDVLPFLEVERKIFRDRQGRDWSLNLTSQRLKLFRGNRTCVCCGIEGTFLKLEQHLPQDVPHFNLYASTELYGDMMLTKDHIIPKSAGGLCIMSNYQTMCARCNAIKDNQDITLEQLRIMVSNG